MIRFSLPAFPVAMLLAATLAGCGGLIPEKTVKVSPSFSVPLEKVVFWGAYAGAAWLVVDPLAPNWEIEETPLPDNHIHFALKMKRYYAGGAGEARVVFHRRAKALVQYGGFGAYDVLEYTEGLESSALGAQRVVEGVIRLTEKPAAGQGSAPPARSTPASATNPLS